MTNRSLTYLQPHGDVNKRMMPQHTVVFLTYSASKETEMLFWSWGKEKTVKTSTEIVFILSSLSFITLFTIKCFKERFMEVRDDYLWIKEFILNLVSDWMVTTVLIWEVTVVVSWLKLTVLALTSYTEELCMHYHSAECPKIFSHHLSRKCMLL